MIDRSAGSMATLPQFDNPALLEQALTHRSYLNEHAETHLHNERMEFLGDAILTFLSGEFLYRRYPDRPEGELTPLRAALVNEAQLAHFGRQLELGSQLRLGKGAAQDGGRSSDNLLSSAFEAVVGAYFLDGQGEMDPVRRYVEPFWELVVDDLVVAAPQVNYKSRFQHWALTQRGANPQYEIAATTGPDHDPQFVATVVVLGQPYGQGQGRSKKIAEKAAAQVALEGLCRSGLLESC
jgi:ribonuclease III